MQAFIQEFTELLQLEAPEGCADEELFFALKAYRVCREGAWEGTRFADIGTHVRSWLNQPSCVERMKLATRDSCAAMRLESIGIYIVKQLPDYHEIAREALGDADGNIRCVACEALHDLGANGYQIAALKETLMDLALRDPQYFVRSRATSALRFYPSHDVIGLLRHVLQNDHEFDEQYVIESPSTAAEYALNRMKTNN